MMDPIDEILKNDAEAAINDAANGEPLTKLYTGIVRYSKLYLIYGIMICTFCFIFAIISILAGKPIAALCFIPITLPGVMLIKGYKKFRIVFDEDSFTYTNTSGRSSKYFFFDVMAFEETESRFIIYLPEIDIEIPARCSNINEFLQNMPEWTKAQNADDR